MAHIDAWEILVERREGVGETALQESSGRLCRVV